jgi:hypothetical protein
MVRPWDEWLMVSLPKDPTYSAEAMTKEMWEEAWRDLINDWECPVEIKSVSTWRVNEVAVRSDYGGREYH